MNYRSAFTRVEPVEVFRLERDAKGWRGVAEADIELGKFGAAWIFAAAATTFSGDHSGFCEPLGFTGPAPRRCFDTRDAALAAAIARIETVQDGRLTPRAVAWLRSLTEGRQTDLFAEMAA